MVSLQDDDHSEFISPFLRNDTTDEIVTVSPQEPGRNNRKVYLIKKEAGLTGRSYLQCSACRHRAFKLFRNVTQSLAPDHLKRYGSWENEVLRFCRTCWYRGDSSKHGEDRPENRPNFDRGPLGVTDQRACVSWHFLQRDFVRRRHGEKEENLDGKNREARVNQKKHNDVMLPLVSVVGQRGNEFVKKDSNANLFDFNGNEVSLRNNESGYLSIEHSPSSDRQDHVSSILMNIHKDHDYAPAVQREIEITTSTRSPVKDYYHGNNFQRPNSKFEIKNDVKMNKRTYKVKYNKEQVKQAANKLLKKAVMYDGTSKPVHNFVTVNLPVSKVEEELRSKREKGEGPDPNHLMGLKARAADGQTLPGLICPLCGKHTVKSYSVWKKNNAPAKILHLFKDGVTVIRACRKCVPYPINREREKRKGENKPASQSTASNAVKCDKPANAAKPLMNGYAKKTTNGKNSVLDSKGNGEVSKVNNSVVANSTVVKETVVTKANKDREVSAKNKRNGENVEVDNLKKKAKIEEKKRTIEEVSGHELTGLECFESLQSEERIDSAGGQDAESFLLCNETRRDPEATRNGETSARVTRGRPTKASLVCDKCNTPLGKIHRTVKLANCPKKLVYFFKENRNRRSMKICKNCSK
ncbi:uncharacterized protein LOC135688987 [Rhopilema esculentum]|uniref:uncharacterized protein LOC135688987 n=1 Tax=Rhopilema esculentum TaxID=499914 RepID=UPI0031D62E16